MSDLEDTLALHLRVAGIPYEREVRLVSGRKWRYDFVLPAHLVVEVEGGTWLEKSRHTTGSGFEHDAAKYAEATCLGFRVLRVTGKQVKSGEALRWVQRALEPAEGEA